MLWPRWPQPVEKHSSAVRRLVEKDACWTEGAAGVWNGVGRIGYERELEILAGSRGAECVVAKTTTIIPEARSVPLTAPTAVAAGRMIVSIAATHFVFAGSVFGSHAMGNAGAF